MSARDERQAARLHTFDVTGPVSIGNGSALHWNQDLDRGGVVVVGDEVAVAAGVVLTRAKR